MLSGSRDTETETRWASGSRSGCWERPGWSASSSSSSSRGTRGSSSPGSRPASAPRARATRTQRPGGSRQRSPRESRGRTVDACTPGKGPRLVFSALDAAVAGDLEQAFADAGHVVLSNARNHRMDPMVPLLVPEVNADHLALLRAQAKRSGGKGAIVTNPNCSTVVLSMALAPLRRLRPARVPREHDAGRLGRRLSRRALARHPRQRDPVHLGRGREDGDGDAQDPRHALGRRPSSRTPCA